MKDLDCVHVNQHSSMQDGVILTSFFNLYFVKFPSPSCLPICRFLRDDLIILLTHLILRFVLSFIWGFIWFLSALNTYMVLHSGTIFGKCIGHQMVAKWVAFMFLSLRTLHPICFYWQRDSLLQKLYIVKTVYWWWFCGAHYNGNKFFSFLGSDMFLTHSTWRSYFTTYSFPISI